MKHNSTNSSRTAAAMQQLSCMQDETIEDPEDDLIEHELLQLPEFEDSIAQEIGLELPEDDIAHIDIQLEPLTIKQSIILNESPISRPKMSVNGTSGLKLKDSKKRFVDVKVMRPMKAEDSQRLLLSHSP